MCGIVAGFAVRDISKILLAGLKRLEYRGYDSAGMMVVDAEGESHSHRTLGKVSELEKLLSVEPLPGRVGIAHTRWATHGVPHTRNAHPIRSEDGAVALVHNGIIENYEEIRDKLDKLGYLFESETDTECVAHFLHHLIEKQHYSPLEALQAVCNQMKGAYALAIILKQCPDRIFAICHGCPLVVGIGFDENFLASDQIALLHVTQRFIYLQDGDILELNSEHVKIYDFNGMQVERNVHYSELSVESIERGLYRHYMLKEIYDQPTVIRNTLAAHTPQGVQSFTHLLHTLQEILPKVKRIHIVACGTSYHAGMIGRYWFEEISGIACQVEVASEMRYRAGIVEEGTLLIGISQSGETLDTLAALRDGKNKGYITTVGICNVAESIMAREVGFAFFTKAGLEIGVASTKAFSTQLVVLLQLAIAIGLHRQHITEQYANKLLEELVLLPHRIKEILALEEKISQVAKKFVNKAHTLFLGRGMYYPLALEGALKLKEISYIHAEAYPAGELKHGPLALVDENMPVIAIAPKNEYLEKLKSNLKEVHARGAELFIFAAESCEFNHQEARMTVIELPDVNPLVAPIAYVVPLQLLAYYVAVLKGTDVDQPRNLAKSVTVE